MTQGDVELQPAPAAPSQQDLPVRSPGDRPAEPRRGRSFRPRYPAWLVMPSFVYYLIFFLGAMAILVAFSLATQTGFGQISYGFSLAQYRQVLSSLYLSIFLRTMVMAFLGTALTIAVGYPVAYWMARYLTTYKMLALLLTVVPFWTSFLIRTYALKIILDPQGYVATYLHIDIMYTKYAVAVGLVYNYLPLFILPVFATLERMDWTLVEAATDLGASPLTAFRQITLPLTLPGVVTGGLLVLIPMTGEYIIPNILGGGTFEFVGNLIGDQFNVAQNQPFGSALAITLMFVLSVLVAAYIFFAGREERFGA
jgi:spermidine/putrescine transport system permease protein